MPAKVNRNCTGRGRFRAPQNNCMKPLAQPMICVATWVRSMAAVRMKQIVDGERAGDAGEGDLESGA